MANSKGIMKPVLGNMLQDLKTVYTDTWFLPADSFQSAVTAWHKVLGDYTYDQLRTAFDEYVRTHDRPPMPSVIRDIVLQGSPQTAPQDPAEVWRRLNYWVLVDLDGYHINETTAAPELTEDDVAAYFRRAGQDMAGTVLLKVNYSDYVPKYRMERTLNLTKEEVMQMFRKEAEA